MKKIDRLKDYSLKKNNRNQENQKDNIVDSKTEKILCKHCRRTVSNGIRCQGICVADNEY